MCKKGPLDLDHLIKKYGNFSLATTSIQENMQYFIREYGYIAYRQSASITAVLADPVCDPVFKDSLLKDFLNEHTRCIFVQCSDETAETLKSLGLHILAFGDEHHINPQKFRLNWKNHKSIKRAYNYYSKKVSINFREIHSCEAYIDDILTVQNQWLTSRTTQDKDLYFLMKPLQFETKNTRHFVLFNDTQLICYAQCEPIYKDEKIFGYYLSNSFFNPESKHSLVKYLVTLIIDIFKKEGIEVFSLGVSPFSKYSSDKFKTVYSCIFLTISKLIGSFIYNFSGIFQFKNSFKSSKVPSFIATHKKCPIREFIVVLEFMFNKSY